MHANVEDRGIKGDITPLMAAASGGYVDIVKLLLVHGADVNAQSSTGRNKKVTHMLGNYILLHIGNCLSINSISLHINLGCTQIFHSVQETRL